MEDHLILHMPHKTFCPSVHVCNFTSTALTSEVKYLRKLSHQQYLRVCH